MITIWNLEEAKTMHQNSEPLANFLINFLPKSKTVYDFGCGTGFYLSKLSENKFRCIGVEGTPGINEISHFKEIKEADLSKPLDLKTSKGTVLSFEVAEHLAPEQEYQFVKNLLKYCDRFLIISWAIEGQNGYGHNNMTEPAFPLLLDEVNRITQKRKGK